jgi:hypothetical protein
VVDLLTAAGRRVLLTILVLAIAGTCAELLFLEHTDGFWQMIPVTLLATALLVTAWHLVQRGPASVRLFQALMIAFMVSGVVGLVQHFTGNMEFELEMHPGASGFALWWDTLNGATPALAPGTMIQLGLLGLVYAHRHPALQASAGIVSKED